MKTDLTNLLSKTGDVALKRRAKWIIERLNSKKGDKILDVGCGDSFYLYLLSSLNLEVDLTGIDFDARALVSARKNLKDKKVTLIKSDLMKKIPFVDESFDKVLACEVIEHLPDDIKGLKEVYRVLKPGGKIVISVPHQNYPFLWDPINWLLERLIGKHIKNGFWAGIWHQHLRLYTPLQLASILKETGFKKIDMKLMTHYCLPFNHYLINLGARILADKQFSSLLKKEFSKFGSSKNKQVSKINLLKIFFLFDKLNDSWDGRGSAVSLVASAIKSS